MGDRRGTEDNRTHADFKTVLQTRTEAREVLRGVTQRWLHREMADEQMG